MIGRAHTHNGIPAIIENLGSVNGDFLQTIADSLKGRFKGVIVLGGATGGAVSLLAAVSPDFTSKHQAGKIVQTIAPIVGGKGGGKPDNARGGGKDAAKLNDALTKARSLLGSGEAAHSAIMLQDEQPSPDQIAILRRMTPEQRWRAAHRLYWSCRRHKAAYLGSTHPDWPRQQIEDEVKRIF